MGSGWDVCGSMCASGAMNATADMFSKPPTRLVDEGVVYSAISGRCSPRSLMQSWREEALQHGLDHARRPMTPFSPKLTSHQLKTLQYSPRKPPVPRPVTAPDEKSPRARAAAGARKAAHDESTRRAAELQLQLEAATIQVGALRDAHEALAVRCAQLETARRRSSDGLVRQRRALARRDATVTELARSKEELAVAAEGAENTLLELQLDLHERARKLREATDRELELRRALAASEAAAARLAAEAGSERQAAATLAGEKAELAEQLGALRQTHELTRIELLQESGTPSRRVGCFLAASPIP